MARIRLLAIATALLPVLNAMALELDPPGRPNESGTAISEKLASGEMPLDERFEYFSHYSPVIRMNASHSMAKEGAKAMPYVIRGLQSKDRHVVRASCDAITAFRGFFGVNVKGKTSMAPEVAAPAVPYLVPLLDRPDFYIQAGALQALSKCGKAAAPHLSRAVKFLDDDEWWLRLSAAYVMQGVGSPEADQYAVELAEVLLKERHIMCLNGLTASLKELMKTAWTCDEIAELIGRNLVNMERAYIRQRGRDVLNIMGRKAKAALPYLDKLVEQEARYIEKAEKEGTLGSWDKWDLENLKKTREKIAGEK